MRTVIGCMSGTSMDAVDGARVSIDGHGLNLRARLEAIESEPLGVLSNRLRAIANGRPATAGECASLARSVGEAHARVVGRLAGAEQAIDLVCAHGQTVFHGPGLTWQTLDPWPIALVCECPVVFDLRGADVIAGGRGAPITPLADWMLFRDAGETRAIVNLGGFCNVTLLPAGAGWQGVRGFDVCACNQVLDEAARRALKRPFDEGGAFAASGVANADAVRDLATLLARQAEGARSLGTGDEAGSWIDAWIARLSPEDLLSSAATAVGRVVAQRTKGANRVLLAGGGAQNGALAGAISAHADAPVAMLDILGVPAGAREAVAMAILGALCADGVRITLPQVTGRGDAPLLDGCWVNARVAR